MPLTIRNLPNHIKRIKLQPARKVTRHTTTTTTTTTSSSIHIQPFRLLQKQPRRIIHKRLVLHQRRHGKRRVDTPTELHVEVVVRRAEQRRQAVAFDDGLLDDVEVGLHSPNINQP